MPKFVAPVVLPDGNRATGDLADVAVSTPGALAAYFNSGVTAAGTYTAPTPATVMTVPPQRFAVTNRTTGDITLTFPNPAGTTIPLALMAGEVITFRQVTTAGYINESGNKGRAQLDARYRASLFPSATITAAANLAAGVFYPADPTSAAFTVTLPTAPYDGAIIEVENTNTTNTNAVTVARGGTTDTIESVTTVTIAAGDFMVFRYRASDARWLRRRWFSSATAGTNVRRDKNGQFAVSTANGDRLVGGPNDNLGTVVYNSGWGTRPTGYAVVQWIGGTSMTPPPAVAGDIWTRA